MTSVAPAATTVEGLLSPIAMTVLSVHWRSSAVLPPLPNTVLPPAPLATTPTLLFVEVGEE